MMMSDYIESEIRKRNERVTFIREVPSWGNVARHLLTMGMYDTNASIEQEQNKRCLDDTVERILNIIDEESPTNTLYAFDVSLWYKNDWNIDERVFVSFWV